MPDMNSSGKELISFTKKAITLFPRLDDIVDKLIEPVKDYTDTLADLGLPIKTVLSIVSYRQRLMLKSFLKNYANCLLEDYELDQKEIEKLEGYLSKKENLQFISEIIESGVQAKAIKCSAILGVLAGRTLKEKQELNDRDVVMIETLSAIHDIDLMNFAELIESYRALHRNNNWDFKTEFRTLEMYERGPKWTTLKVSKASLELTIEKLKRTGALSFGAGGIGSVGNARGAFVFSPYTEALYTLIRQTKVL